MKIFKLSFILIAMFALLLVGGTAFAFHSGGVAECSGCHTMHGAAGPSLMVAVDPSSTCLSCHGASGQSSYHIATPSAEMPAGTPPNNETPGGDFGWLAKSTYYTVRGGASTNPGETHGHNVVAAGYDTGYLTASTINATAPGGGGSFNSATLSCVSCHDQHGKGRWLTTGSYAKTGQAIYTSGSYGGVPTTAANGELLATGVYRLLRGTGDLVGGVTYATNPPVAVAPSTYNRSEFFSQTRVVYGSGMSEWCANCHADMHGGSGLKHPTGSTMSGAIQGNYNQYVKSGNMTGSQGSSYLSLVPYEEGKTYSAANVADMKKRAQINDSQLGGPTGAAQVMCLSCHRAHASAFGNMFRWNEGATTITVNGAYPTGNDAGIGYSAAEISKGMYDYNVTKFSAYQRQLCNKCHAKD